jgi:ribulose-5-phosphate 4-epimerase/fuculose-1-phosphate aldolase
MDDFALVRRYSISQNSVESEGLIQPSSEAMTHGAIYDLGSHVRFVYHGHCPVIWKQAKSMGIPVTDPGIPYGTPEMAREMARLYQESTLPQTRVLAMGGHEDGIIVFGKTPDEAGALMVQTLATAYTRICAEGGGQLCVTGPG